MNETPRPRRRGKGFGDLEGDLPTPSTSAPTRQRIAGTLILRRVVGDSEKTARRDAPGRPQ